MVSVGPLLAVLLGLSPRLLTLLIGFRFTSEKVIPHYFGVLKLSLFMGFVANSIKILQSVSHSFGMGTFIIVAVAAYYFFGISEFKV